MRLQRLADLLVILPRRLVLAALFAFVGGCAGHAKKKLVWDDVPCGFRIVHGDGFSLAVPRYWRSSTARGVRRVFDAEGPLARVDVERVRFEGKPRAAMARFEQSFDAPPEYVELGERDAEDADGGVVVEYRHEGRDDRRVYRLHGWAYAAVHGDWAYVVECQVAEEETEMLRSSCESVIDSMVLE